MRSNGRTAGLHEDHELQDSTVFPMTNSSTHRVVSNFELLHRNTGLLGNSPDEECGLSVGGVSLVGVGLDHHTAVQSRGMVGLVLVSIVGVDL